MANRINTFLIKRSNTPGKVPSAGSLLLGEIALNTADAKLYTSGTTANSILPIGWDRVSKTGDTMTGTLFVPTISATSINKVDYIVFNTGTTSAATVAGTIYFDNTEKTLSYNTSINQGVTVNLGQQQYLRVFNNSGTVIAKGKALEVFSAFSGLPSVTLAINKHTGFNVVGISAEAIPNNSEGIVITKGIISNIPITGVSIGSLVYASDSVPGQLDNATKYLNFPLTARTNSVGYVVQTGTTTGKIFVDIQNENSVLAFTDLERDILEGNIASTGAFSFSGISLITSTTFNVSPMQGWIIDNTTNPLVPDAKYINYSGGTGLTTPYLTSFTETYLMVNSANTLTFLNTFPTPQQRRQNIYLGKLGHANKTSLINSFNETDFDISPLSQLRDMFTPIRLINSGVIPSPNGANMNFNTSAGSLWGLGIGFTTNALDPNSFSISGGSPTTFQYRTQTGGTSSNTTTIIPSNYDLNGVVTAIGLPAKQATNQRIFLVQNGNYRIQYGQTLYSDLTAAVAGSQSESFNTFVNFKDNGILLGVLSLRSDTTNLSDSDYARFLPASKFGEVIGGTGGLSTTTLQQAYNNSTQPEIIINSTLDGLSIQNGTGSADTVTRLLEGQNTAGSVTSFIRADGYISGTTLQIDGTYLNNNGITATTISATTYLNLPSGSTSPISVISGSSLFSTGFSGTGLNASGVTNSNFFGQNAGYQASAATGSNFFGNYAGNLATNAFNSNFFGRYAGSGTTNANGSNFFGNNAGNLATNASFSNFFGLNAGKDAINGTRSNFFGAFAGQSATGASLSTLFGYNVGNAVGLGTIGSNNIIIGTNISLPSGTTNSINLGGVLFGSGTYSTSGGTPSITAQTQGKIGINVVTPLEALHVSGNTRVEGAFSASSDVYAYSLVSTQSVGDEGGEIRLTRPATNTTLSGSVTIDVWQNRVRVFETGGTNRGGYWDVSALGAGVTTNFLGGSSTFTGGTVTGPTKFTNGITANTISATTYVGNNLTLTSTGSTSNPFVVNGVSGQLFSISDSLVGDIWIVSDISGIPILTVNSNDIVKIDGSLIMNSANVSGLTATTTVQTIPIASGTSAFFDYYVTNVSTGAYRAGTIMSVWNATTASYTDNATPDLVASTAGIEFTVDISGTDARLRATITSGTWKVKVGTRIL